MLMSTSPSNWTLLEKVFVAAASGITSHLCFYKHGEHHMKTPILFRLYVILFFMLLYGEITVKDQDALRGTTEALSIAAAYNFSLLTSIVVYRKVFHRLRSFPGPFMASVTKLWQTANTLNSQNHLLLDDLHKKYGDFVRTGKWMSYPLKYYSFLTHREMFKAQVR